MAIPPVFSRVRLAGLCMAIGLICALPAWALTSPTTAVSKTSPAAAANQGSPFDMTAGHLDYDLDAGKVIASEGVMISGTEGHVTAQTITYTMSPTLIVATGNVVYIDNTSNTMYLDKLQLTGRMEQGVAEHMRLALPHLGEVASATQVVKINSSTYVLHNVVYSPCQTCTGNAKPWQIRADRMTYHQDTQTMQYHDAKFDVYGHEVVYLPYFSNQLGPTQPKNGLLAPLVGYSSTFGAEARLGAYYYDSPTNADYTFRTRLMTERGAQVEINRRQITDTTYSEVTGSYLHDQQTETDRNDLKIIAEKTFAPGVRIGVNGEITSDDGYLNQYYNRTDPYLASTIYGEKDDLNTYMGLSATHFQDLDPNHSSAQTLQELPHFQYEKLIEMNGLDLARHGTGDGSQILFDADALNLQRDDGPQYRRLTSSVDYTKPYFLQDGSKLTFDGLLRVDGYDVDGNANGNGETGRILPEATLKWEKPYVSADGDHTITPMVMGALSPHGNNPNGIPNLDSVAYELDITNLFEPNRFAGIDRIETGPRIVYGVDNRWGTADSMRYRLFVGQSYRKYNDDDLPLAGGAGTSVSDYVGLAEFDPTNWMSFSTRFRLDNSTLQPRRVDASMRLGDTNKIRLLTTYTYLNGAPLNGDPTTEGPEQMTADFRAPLNERYELVSRLQEDLQANKLLYGEAGVIYKQDCYSIEVLARRRGYDSDSPDLQPSTDYLVNLRLLTMGTDN